MNLLKLKKNPKILAILSLVLIFVISVIIGLVITRDDQKKADQALTKTATISITAGGFDPSVLAVKQGTKIVWTNQDEAIHQVVSNSHPEHKDLAELKSEVLNDDQTYEYTANQKGTYGYHDEMDPTLNGKLIIE